MSKEAEQLIEYNVQDVVKIIAMEHGATAAEAMNNFYRSKTCAGLMDPETGLYLQSPSYIYELFSRE